MSLYKMELYKICRKKMTVAVATILFVTLLSYFAFGLVGSESTMVDGTLYQGYEAVQKDRKITEKFKGILTDEKVSEIADTYGLPKVVEEDYGYFRDANYLTEFVTNWLTDGYLRDWDDYKIPETVSPIATSELGKSSQNSGKEVTLVYTKGWNALLDFYQMGMMLVSIFIILAIAPVFSEEYQTKAAAIIFTTEYGRNKDIAAKIAAAFTVSFGVFGIVALLGLVLCGGVYGLDGSQVIRGVVLQDLNAYFGLCMESIGRYCLLYLGVSFGAMIMLNAMVLWVSAHFVNSYHAVTVATLFWSAPILLRMFFNNGILYLIETSQPIFLIMANSMYETEDARMLQIIIIFMVVLGGTILSYRKYSRMEVV